MREFWHGTGILARLPTPGESACSRHLRAAESGLPGLRRSELDLAVRLQNGDDVAEVGRGSL
jgi:hypothetical protein